MQRASAIDQQNHEHVQAKGRFAIDLSGPTSRPITPAPVCATGGKPSTRLPPGELVEQLRSPEIVEPTKDNTRQNPGEHEKILCLASRKCALLFVLCMASAQVDLPLDKTWGTPLADERGCEALSPTENTRNPLEITENEVLENELEM